MSKFADIFINFYGALGLKSAAIIFISKKAITAKIY